MICAKNVSFDYQDDLEQKSVLKDVSFCLPTGRITIFLGKSGAGKTTLFSCITQLQKKYTGTITIDDVDIQKMSSQQRASSIGFVSQQFNLFPHLTVLKNCSQPLQIVLGLSSQKADKRALEMLSLLNIETLRDNCPAQLSGGQQQRVAIARALCFKPQVLLLDEPTSSLDPQNTKNIVDIIQNLCQNNIAIGITSHDMAFVSLMVDRIYFMQEGKIAEQFDKQVKSTFNDGGNIQLFLNTKKDIF